MAQLGSSSKSFPIRNIFRNKKHISVKMCEVLNINPAAKLVQTDKEEIKYDRLVIATGCRTNFFNNAQIEQHALTLKSTTEAIQVRNHLLTIFESLSSQQHLANDPRNNIVIVGGGPTGVELAGAFSEIIKKVLPEEYPLIDAKQMKVILVEGSAHTLNNMSDLAKVSSEKYLKQMGVEIITNTFVKDYDGKNAVLSNGEILLTSSLIWAAGVSGNILPGLVAEAYLPNSRYKVDRFNEVHNHNHIYAIGDIAYMETPMYPKGHQFGLNLKHAGKNSVILNSF